MTSVQHNRINSNINKSFTPVLLLLTVLLISVTILLFNLLPVEPNWAFLKEGYTVTADDRDAAITSLNFFIEFTMILAALSAFLLGVIIACMLKPFPLVKSTANNDI